jgi:hypothetical protein
MVTIKNVNRREERTLELTKRLILRKLSLFELTDE